MRAAAPAALPAERTVTAKPTPAIDLEEPSTRGGFSQWAVRIAAVLVVAAAIGGGTVMWRRTASAPKVGTAAFDSAPAGAQVFVDGKPVGTTPVRVELNPGNHAVEFKLKDATRTDTIAITGGSETALSVDWNPRRVGGLQVASTPPGAVVRIDGRDRGRTPLTLNDLAVGTHTVQIESSEGSVSRKVTVADGRSETLNESIYPGWLQVSSPIEVVVMDGANSAQLDARGRVLLKAGPHSLRFENRALEFSQTKQIDIEPGGTTRVSVDVPTSTLTVTGSTGADVFVDGAKVGVTPLVDFQVKIGPRDVMVVAASGATRHASVTVTTRPTQLEISF